MFIELYNRNRVMLAILENVSNITETKILNGLDTLGFWLPIDDNKNEYCELFNLVKFNNSVYRIVKSSIDTSTHKIQYECEHIIAKLIDSVMYGYHVVGNLGYYTSQVIEYVLKGQDDFVLDICQFTRQFEYGWEQENRYTALFNIPSSFTDNYIWHFDTSSYPYKISLLLLSTDGVSDHYIRAKYNLLKVTRQSSALDICTRLYALGSGEGVNQLGYDSGYLQSPDEYVDKYGIIERVWIDRRYENLDSLLEARAAMLEALQEPYIEWSIDSALLDTNTEYHVGEMLEIIDSDNGIYHKTYINSVKKVYGDVDTITLSIANKPSDIAGTVADLADRQRIEMAYSQGATQIYTSNIQENADSTEGATLDFYVPEGASIINSVVCKIKRTQFRAYSKATGGGGATTATSSSGGSHTLTSAGGGSFNETSSSGGSNTLTSAGGGSFNETSSSGGSHTLTSESGGSSTSTSTSGGGFSVSSASGGSETLTSASNTIYSSTSETNSIVSKSTESGGGSAQTSTEGAGTGLWSMSGGVANAIFGLYPTGVDVVSHYHALAPHTHPHDHSLNIPAHDHDFSVPVHSHSFTVDPHTHKISIPTHTHTVTVGTHNHSVSIPAHTHSVSIPTHTHTLSVGTHTHSIYIPTHTHTLSVGTHTHSVSIPTHTHTVTLPNHTHTVEAGIFRSGSASSCTLYIEGSKVLTFNDSSYELDITQYLVNSSTGLIPRGQWLSVTVVPNDLAYISINLAFQGYIQSRGDATV